MTRWTFCVAFVAFLISCDAKADVVFSEDFEEMSGLIIAGDFEAPWIQWGVAPLTGTVEYPSNFVQGGTQSGNIFFAAQVKEGDGADAATVTMILPDLTGYTDLQLTVSLAAAENVFESTHRDSLHIIGNTTTTPPVLEDTNPGFMPVANSIDNFLPPLRPSSLRSAIYPSTDLGVQFQDFTYPIANNLQSLTFGAGSTGGDEHVGIDSVVITGTPVPEPSAFLFLLFVGICAGGLSRGTRKTSVCAAMLGNITLPIMMVLVASSLAQSTIVLDVLVPGEVGSTISNGDLLITDSTILNDGVNDVLLRFTDEKRLDVTVDGWVLGDFLIDWEGAISAPVVTAIAEDVNGAALGISSYDNACRRTEPPLACDFLLSATLETTGFLPAARTELPAISGLHQFRYVDVYTTAGSNLSVLQPVVFGAPGATIVPEPSAFLFLALAVLAKLIPCIWRVNLPARC